MTDDIEPFADDDTVLTVGGLSLENGTDAVLVHGDVEIRRDRRGLETARRLAEAFGAIATALDKEKDLPERASVDQEGGGSVDNPFR